MIIIGIDIGKNKHEATLIDEKGNIGSYEIVESVICVNRRMSYSEVQKVLDGDETAREGCMEAVPMLEEMARLSQALRKKRRERGAVDFDFPESKIRLDAEGNPVEIVPYERNDATKLIEDFMLAANETVAQHFYWLELPFLYRVHDTPDGDRMKELAVFLQNFGYRLHLGGSGKKKGGKGKGGISAQNVQVHPKQLQKLLDQIEGTPEEAMLARLILRSMRRAFYSPECTGHFGLAAHQGIFAGALKRRADRALCGYSGRCGAPVLGDGTAGGRGGAHL